MLNLSELKHKVHSLTNSLQSVLGYIELKEFDKAKTHAVELAVELRALSKLLSGVAAGDISLLEENGKPVTVSGTMTGTMTGTMKRTKKKKPPQSVKP